MADDIALAVASLKIKMQKELAKSNEAVIARVRGDFLAFMNELVYVHDPPPGRGFVKWESWPHLEELSRTLPSHQHIVVLKGRQLGLSWCLAAYALWVAMFKPGAMILLLSQGQKEAKEFKDKVVKVHSQLPDGIRTKVVKNIEEEFRLMSVDGGDSVPSTIMVLPSTANAGSGFTATLVVCDEHAKHPYATVNYAALEPTINAGGQFVSVSTANGIGNFFYNLYQNAKSRTNDFHQYFFHAQMRPGRDDEWYEATKRSYTGETAYLFSQEYPRNDAEAFITTSGRPVFDVEALERLLSGVKTPIRTENYEYGSCLYYKDPVPGKAYVAGTDVCYGLSSPDGACTQILDARTGTHVASLYGFFPPEQLADYSIALCHEYNDALWGLEDNGVGQFAVRRALDIGYGNLFYRDAVESRAQGKRPTKAGWHTGSNRHDAIAEFAEGVRTGEFDTQDEGTIGEMRTFIFLWGKPQAATGAHDDRVMATAIAWQMRQQPGAIGGRGPARSRRFIKRR